MESISEETFNQREQEIINFYKKYYKEDAATNAFNEKYLNVLKVVQGLGSSNSETREKSRGGFISGLNGMIQYQSKVGVELFDVSMQELMSMIEIMSNAIRWEGKSGALIASTIVLEKFNYREFEDKTLNASIDFLFQNEFGFLQQILNYIQAYTKKHGQDSFLNIREKLYNQMNSLWAQNNSIMEEETEDTSTFRARSVTDQALESLYKTLASFIEGFSIKSKLIDSQLLEIISKTLNHSKPEIRTLGCDIVGGIVIKLSDEIWNENIVPIGDFLVELMGDEDPTVRQQATTNVFKFIDRAAASNALQQFTPRIVPRILINRYHPVVNKDSITLWKTYLDKIGLPKGGREVLAGVTNEACAFYLQQLKYNNAEVLKAALGALKELITKVKGSEETIKTNFEDIVTACMRIARHEVPAIRSNCFNTLGSLVSKCPEQAKTKLKELIDLGFLQICVNSGSEDAAESVASYLGEIYKTFKDEVHVTFNKKIKDKLAAWDRLEETIQVEEDNQFVKKNGHKGYEVVTGALILLAELVKINIELLDQNIDRVNTILTNRKPKSSDSMILYAWKAMHGAILTWDKTVVTTKLDAIIQPMFSDFESGKQNIKAEIKLIIKDAAGKIGPNIFKSKVESVFGPKFSKYIQEIVSAPPK